MPELSMEQRVQNSKYDLANQLLYNPIERRILQSSSTLIAKVTRTFHPQLALIKASIIVFLWRQATHHSMGAQHLLRVQSTSRHFRFFVADLCQCTPVHYYWDKWWMAEWDDEGNIIKPGGYCIDAVKFLLISAGLAVLTDVMILVIPAAMVWNLRMPRKKIIAVCVVIGCVRLALYYYRFRPNDIDRSYSISITTSGMEVNIALIACCGPALKALSTRHFPGLFGAQSRASTHHRASIYNDHDGYNRSGDKATSTYRHREQLSSKGDRPEDAQYGLRDLGVDGRETDGDSQEAIVHAASVSTKRDDELDFGFDGMPEEPRRDLLEEFVVRTG